MFDVPPDLDGALITFAKAHPVIAPLVTVAGKIRVGLEVTGPEQAIRISNLGGPALWPWFCRAEFQIDAWGGTSVQAGLIARAFCSAIYDARGPIADGYITAAFPTLWPIWRPAVDTNRPRYISQVQIEATPEEP